MAKCKEESRITDSSARNQNKKSMRVCICWGNDGTWMDITLYYPCLCIDFELFRRAMCDAAKKLSFRDTKERREKHKTERKKESRSCSSACPVAINIIIGQTRVSVISGLWCRYSLVLLMFSSVHCLVDLGR